MRMSKSRTRWRKIAIVSGVAVILIFAVLTVLGSFLSEIFVYLAEPLCPPPTPPGQVQVASCGDVPAQMPTL
jgi:hypothetical protein